MPGSIWLFQNMSKILFFVYLALLDLLSVHDDTPYAEDDDNAD